MTATNGTSLLALVLLACAGSASRASDDFEKHVRPLLVEKCQSCHGAEKAKGGLRLDLRAALLKGGESGPAAVPGKPAASLLVKAIGYTGELKMPPKGKLSDEGQGGRHLRTVLRRPRGEDTLPGPDVRGPIRWPGRDDSLQEDGS